MRSDSADKSGRTSSYRVCPSTAEPASARASEVDPSAVRVRNALEGGAAIGQSFPADAAAGYVNDRRGLRRRLCGGHQPGDHRKAEPREHDYDRGFATYLVDITSVTWSDDSRAVLAVGHRDRSTDHDCWILQLDGREAIDTGALRQARQQGLIVIAMAPAWSGDSILFSAAGRQGLHVWRQRLSPTSFQAHGAPELLTPGGESAFFPTGSHGRLGYVGVHADMNMWRLPLTRARGKLKACLDGLPAVPVLSVISPSLATATWSHPSPLGRADLKFG